MLNNYRRGKRIGKQDSQHGGYRSKSHPGHFVLVWRKVRQNGTASKRTAVRCFYCNKIEPVIKQCRIRKKKKTKQPARLTNVKLHSSVGEGQTSYRQMFSVTAPQCAAQDHDYELNATDRNEIVENSGASEHGLWDIKLHSEVQQLPDAQVRLSNCPSVVSNQRGK